MKPGLIVLLAFALIATASADCPYTSGSATVEHCRLIIGGEMLYGREINIGVDYGIKTFQPVEGASVRVEYYDNSANKTLKMLKTDKEGQATFMPEVVGYHLIRLRRGGVCDSDINELIYVNTSCGDGVCGGWENRSLCAEDCGRCGDGVCDYDENISCPDCAVCGDGVCSAGETRANCLMDCVFCGDGICDYLEDRGSCPDDCLSGEADGFCDGEKDAKCDPDCYDGDPDCYGGDPDGVGAEDANGEPAINTGVARMQKDDESMIMRLLIIILAAVAIAGAVREYRLEKRFKESQKEATKYNSAEDKRRDKHINE